MDGMAEQLKAKIHFEIMKRIEVLCGEMAKMLQQNPPTMEEASSDKNISGVTY